MAATFVLLIWALTGCSASNRPLPRLERYDFSGQTPADLAGLRQIAPAEGPEGALARYALARAHTDWLVVGLVDDQEDGTLLRRLAHDLGVPGASIDDPLTLPQVVDCIDRVLAEIEEAGAAGGEARAWARATARLLRGVRAGWEPFGPDLFRAVAEASRGAAGGAAENPARLAADVMALGWGGVALEAVGDRAPRERAAFLLRMAGYGDPAAVEALTRAEGGGPSALWAAGAGPICPEAEPRLERSAPPLARLAAVRDACSGAAYGFPAPVGQSLSPDLVAASRVLRDLVGRRERVDADDVARDPLRLAAQHVIARFDRALAGLRLPLPLPVPGPRTPAAPVLEGRESAWRPAAVVLSVGPGGELSAGLWPVLALSRGREPRLLDRAADLAVPGRAVAGRGAELGAALEPLFAAAREQLGLEGRSVAILIDGAADVTRLEEVLGRLEGLELSSVDLIAQAAADGGAVSLPIVLDRGAAQARAAADRRALVVVGPDVVQVGTADGRWAELQQDADGAGEQLPEARLRAAMAAHLGGRGLPQCILAVRDGVAVQRVAELVALLERLPGRAGEAGPPGGAEPTWEVRYDPAEPSGPRPVAETAAGAVARHRVRLRACYERYLEAGGEAHGALVLELAVGASGEVTEARAVESELGPAPALESCLIDEAHQIRFPANPDGQTIRVPLRFVPEGLRGERP